MEITKQKKVFVLLPVATGHINPVTGIVSELVKHNVDVIFYGRSQYKDTIERTGATYREYTHAWYELAKDKSVSEYRNTFIELVSKSIKFSDKILPDVIVDVERDKPDIILYDMLSVHVRYMMRILKNRYKKGLSNSRPPKLVEVTTGFAFELGVSPTYEEFKLFTKTNDYRFGLLVIWLIIVQIWFSIKHGLNIINPLSFFTSKEKESEYMTVVFPELQPSVEQFIKKKYKFLGCCIKENIRNVEITDPKLQEFMNQFEPVNPLQSIDQRQVSNKRLIYVSFGTLFNNNMAIFEKVIEAIQMLDKHELRVIFSVGQKVQEQFQAKFARNNYQLPENILITSTVPQIEILKRASLFVTHAGMNSLSETVHYGVPLISIPMNADQPFNAKRATALGFGKDFDPLKLDVQSLSLAIGDVLYNDAYLKNILVYSKLSHKYDGNVNGCNFILDILNDHVKKSD
jgi:UDP:flavonoid glycosyltransferase YjiC (YdhE family)